MRRLAPSCLALLLVVPLLGCGLSRSIAASGRSVSRSYDVTGFNGVDIGSAFDVTVSRGADFAVSVTASESVLNRVVVEMRGTTLHIGLEPGSLFGLRNVTLRAEVTMPELSSLGVSGASRCRLSGFDEETSSLAIDVSGASRLEGGVAAQEMRMDASGASSVELTGTAQSLGLNVSGASTANLAGLQVATADADISGASTALVHVSESLSYGVSGASTLKYSGGPTIDRAEVTGLSNAVPE